MDLLCAMHENGRTGIITGTVLELAQMCRCSEREMTVALNELRRSKTASVTKCHKVSRACTVTNRRMHREYKLREDTKLRVKKHREQQRVTQLTRECNIPSSSSSSSSRDLVSKNLSKERESCSPPTGSLSEDFSPEFLDDLQDQKKSAHLDVRHVLEKLRDWCEARGIKPTRARLIDWLNREIPTRKESVDDDRGTSAQAARVAASLERDN